MDFSKVRGVNLGNWLVLEKWMSPEVFEGTEAEDEIWLNRDLSEEECRRRMRLHRDSFMDREDFRYIAAHGFNMVRIPVPFFVFGDRPPLNGCIDYLDQAFDWAEEKTIVFHDGFRLKKWKNFFNENGMKNVCLDTHIYLYAMELFCPISHPFIHRIYIGMEHRKIEKANRYTPVIVGEWCVCSKYAHRPGKAQYHAAYAASQAGKPPMAPPLTPSGSVVCQLPA